VNFREKIYIHFFGEIVMAGKKDRRISERAGYNDTRGQILYENESLMIGKDLEASGQVHTVIVNAKRTPVSTRLYAGELETCATYDCEPNLDAVLGDNGPRPNWDKFRMALRDEGISDSDFFRRCSLAHIVELTNDLDVANEKIGELREEHRESSSRDRGVGSGRRYAHMVSLR
jgi:hypothetical protein